MHLDFYDSQTGEFVVGVIGIVSVFKSLMMTFTTANFWVGVGQ